jgi:hypothetical protein
MDVQYEALKTIAESRRDVRKWLQERPYVGLSVVDVANLVEGIDYLASIIKQLTGENPMQQFIYEVENEPTITITTGDDGGTF